MILVNQLPLPTDESRSSKDLRNRLGLFIEWGSTSGYDLRTLDLEAYRLYLVDDKHFSPSSVKAHLSSIRAYLRKLITTGSLQTHLYALTDTQLAESERNNIVSQTISHLQSTLVKPSSALTAPERAPRNLGITEHEVNALLDAIPLDTLQELRDAAVIALIAATGIRENEVSLLQVSDLRHHLADDLALHVPPGRGSNERLIPYLKNEWALEVVETWLNYTDITSGNVFRGLYKSGNLLRETGLSGSAVERLLRSYPTLVHGEPTVLKPLDLRHAYASHLYRQGYNLDTIREYIGAKTIQTAWDYVSATARLDPGIYTFDAVRLEKWTRRGSR